MVKYDSEGLYIAGPECFYTNGYELWWAQRKLAEYYGIPVVLPTSTTLKLDSTDLKENAKEIFVDLVRQVEKTSAIIADLELFRGTEPDGGTIFEMGWMWSRGCAVYGYSRDCRTMAQKNPMAVLNNGCVIDQDGRNLPYADLPFCPSIMGSSKIIEGTFEDVLKVYLLDLDQRRKGFQTISRNLPTLEKKQNRVYIATSKRYDSDFKNYCDTVRKQFKEKGFEAVFPGDEVKNLSLPSSLDPYALSQYEFERNMILLSSCSSIVADLNNFHGLEPNNDVSFECGVAYGKNMKLVGFMEDARIMRERIPHYGQEKDFRDWCGNCVENFNLPINLMFSVCFDIREGDITDALKAENFAQVVAL